MIEEKLYTLCRRCRRLFDAKYDSLTMCPRCYQEMADTNEPIYTAGGAEGWLQSAVEICEVTREYRLLRSIGIMEQTYEYNRQTGRPAEAQCKGMTKAGEQCKNLTRWGYCHKHRKEQNAHEKNVTREVRAVGKV